MIVLFCLGYQVLDRQNFLVLKFFDVQGAAGLSTGKGAQEDRKAEVFQVSNDDTTVSQRRLEDKQPEEKTNMDCLRSTQQCLSQGSWAEDTTMSTYLVTRSPSSAIGFKTPIDMLGFFCWLASMKQGMLEPVKVKCIFLGYRKRNMGFNESGEYKKTFIGSGVGTGSMQVLQGDEFEVEPHGSHTFEVKPHRNVNHVVGSLEVQTEDLIHYHPARDREQHSVISKCKFGLKDDMDARSDVYVISNGCKKCSDDSDGYYWESVSHQRSWKTNGKCHVKYAVGSQEYQMVCTRLDIASADVGMLDKFDRGLQKDVQVFVDFNYAMGRSITRYGLMIQGCARKLRSYDAAHDGIMVYN
ncbi:hypothetical protein Tco_1018813 [Tanacetum coccineum]|uniref:Zinc finger, CCHC-type n=1 Tax=Tanacetum coccineum TaxID=301880 RepID=A0ABQ5FVF5_9ASTR